MPAVGEAPAAIDDGLPTARATTKHACASPRFSCSPGMAQFVTGRHRQRSEAARQRTPSPRRAAARDVRRRADAVRARALLERCVVLSGSRVHALDALYCASPGGFGSSAGARGVMFRMSDPLSRPVGHQHAGHAVPTCICMHIRPVYTHSPGLHTFISAPARRAPQGPQLSSGARACIACVRIAMAK